MLAATRWPTWQQAWIAMLLFLAAYALVRRLRPSRATEIALPTLLELSILTFLYGLWRTARKLPLVQADGAIERAESIVDFQAAVGLPSELTLNQWALDNNWLGWSSSAYYVSMHVPGIIAFLIWLFWRQRDHYSRWRNVLALTTAGCLAIRFWRVAPPRFLPERGFVDVTVIHDMDVYGPVGTGVSGQFVAMPSIHVAWAAVVGFGLVFASPSRWRWVAALHLPMTIFVVSATGHHWWLDGIVAIALLLLALAIDETVRRVLRRMRARPSRPDVAPATSELVGDRVEEVVVLGERAELRELGDDVVR